ncbi:photosystem II cytochrome PsbV2 [Thermoleptolyngbya oregonensis NK1-22]|uniref:Photosystem II cytochrome PsbV2 n=1 Tax=Thermoleptolyngbya oregonensis NK1-22 TaxID=2547457 RepID=A0AA97BCE5_9CYAN|nr:photosystem II cytochrome PsbV2 [Thermoleptolyngbya oregonensis NK1-22]
MQQAGRKGTQGWFQRAHWLEILWLAILRPVASRWRVAGWVVIGCWIGAIALLPQGAIAGPVDPYVARFLDASEPVELPLDADTTRPFSAIDLTAGKRLFEENCKNCHVGGSTLPNPTVPLSLAALKGATPPRDTINRLVAFLRAPTTYDGSEEALECRRVSEDWMNQTQVENLSAFILRSAQKAPGWGTADF